jgi:diguanylate cyclase (GGDEF)-like protein
MYVMSITMDWHGHEKTVELDDLVGKVDRAVGGGAVAVALTDLDRFGELNDARGREAGDRVLQVWVDTLTGSLPKDAIVGRLGGDEFGVALPNASAENALILLEEVRAHLADHPVDGWTIAATFGVAARPPHATETADLFRCANEALARGKREGGGRVAIYVEEKMVLKSSYYSRASLDRLAKLAGRLNRTEASLLREALDDLIHKLR